MISKKSSKLNILFIILDIAIFDVNKIPTLPMPDVPVKIKLQE